MLQCNQYVCFPPLKAILIFLIFPFSLRNGGEAELLGKLSLRFLVTRSHNNLCLFQLEIKETTLWFIFGLLKSYRKCRQAHRERKKKINIEEFPYSFVKTQSQKFSINLQNAYTQMPAALTPVVVTPSSITCWI